MDHDSKFITFNPRKLRNLLFADELLNASIITSMRVEDLLNAGES